MKKWNRLPLGDRAILLSCAEAASSTGSGGSPAAAAKRIDAAKLSWVAETVPAYDSVAVYLNLPKLLEGIPPAESEARFEQAADQLLELAEAELDMTAAPAREVTIPVVYGGEAGPDLASSAQRSRLSEKQFAERHSSASYEVEMIGFTPGFPYLRGLPRELSQPRQETPRRQVPSGSVGIAGEQTGVYPVASPGGWQLIGRTPMRLFRPEAEEPFPLRPGDRVKFVPIGSNEEWQEASSMDESRKEASGSAAGRLASDSPWEEGSEAVLTALRPGLLTTVQDLGRAGGWQAFGISVGGAMDIDSLRLANRLVGNEEGAAGLELTLSGGEYRIDRNCLVALTGADLSATVGGESIPLNRPVLLREGAVLRFRGAKDGCRAYLAIAGGLAARPMLGSRSTDVRAGIGGLDGKALQAGDVLHAGIPSIAAMKRLDRLREDAPPTAMGYAGGEFLSHGRSMASTSIALRVLEGSAWNRFQEEARRAFFETEYRVEADSDRMGLRLAGEPLALSRKEEVLSHGVCPGAIQVPASGQPILLAQGCQPTGGYPIIAHVATADQGLLAQLKPGDVVSFEAISLDEALQAYREKEERIARLTVGIRLKWFS